MSDRLTVDTNILIYSIDVSEGDKHLVARNIVATLSRRGSPVALQALNELFFVCIRKKILPLEVAENFNHSLMRTMKVVRPSTSDLNAAMRLHQERGQQFFDALLLATVRRAGCTIFFSEDSQHSECFGDLSVLNPFLLSPAELDQLLA